MNNKIILLIAVIMITSSCETLRRTSNTGKGVAIGSVGGGIIGGVIGNNVGNGQNTALGAILGAVVGGVAGGIIGNKMDKQAEKIRSEIPGAKVERVGEGIGVTFDDNPDGSKGGVYFATGKFNINSNSTLALDKLHKVFMEYPETNVLIEGHTDDVGSSQNNIALSEQRANAVGNYLKTAGLSNSRIAVKGYGESQPKVPNNSSKNKALNRRVHIIITANEKMKAEAAKEAEKK